MSLRCCSNNFHYLFGSLMRAGNNPQISRTDNVICVFSFILWCLHFRLTLSRRILIWKRKMRLKWTSGVPRVNIFDVGHSHRIIIFLFFHRQFPGHFYPPDARILIRLEKENDNIFDIFHSVSLFWWIIFSIAVRWCSSLRNGNQVSQRSENLTIKKQNSS